MNTNEHAPRPLVVVTGATRGLGLAIAQRLLAEGYQVVGAGRESNSAVESLAHDNPECFHFRRLDLENTTAIHAWTRDIIQAFGPLYGLVNNAALGTDGVLATMHESQIRTMLAVNVEAPILLSKYFSRSMLLRRKGRIVNISSIIASTGFSGLAVYGATKSALNGFSRSLSRELGKAGITVNNVAPGYMETDMTQGLDGKKLESIKRRSPSGELASLASVASAVAFLLSPDAQHITGTTLTVDAGSTA